MTIDEFQKADLRVATVTAAERVEGSEKLLKLQLDTGSLDEGGIRQIISGIARQYAPEALVGKQVVIIANLEPRMMMGMESRGMLLVAADAEGKRVPLHPARAVPNGSGVN